MTVAATTFFLALLALNLLNAYETIRGAATVKRVGGLVFVRLGRVGGSFYVARRAAQ
jgi:hypothetical protein